MQHLLHSYASVVRRMATFADPIARNRAMNLSISFEALALRQQTDLRSHYCKATALLAGASGLNGGVQRQNINLKSDIVNGIGKLPDFF